MNAAQVRAKARKAVARREEEVEQEEIEGGEINLIPYLDIVTVLMLFILSITSAGFVLGQIDTTLPDHIRADQAKPASPKEDLDREIQPVVSVTPKGMILWSISGLEGTLQEPKATFERLPGAAGEAPRYDYQRLNDALYEIASRRWKGKPRPLRSYEIILQADGDIPYETVIAVMDAMRRKLPARAGDPMPKVSRPETALQGKERVPIENYDPDEHLLFPDILFSLGFE
jgi:biopolymer transport protein TolR